MGALSGAKRVVKSGLSRRKLAESQGYDTKKIWYHGTPSGELEEFSKDKVGSIRPASFGHHFSNQASEAEMYAGEGGNVGRYVTRQENPLIIELDKYSPYVSAADKADSSRQYILKAIRDAADDGNIHDSVLIRRPMESHTAGEFDRYNENLIMLDSNKIRSIKAEFDPAKKESANLLAGLSGAAVGAGALAGAGASQDAEAGFFGPASKLWNKSAEAAAKKMLRAGASRDSIWRETGIDLGNVDGIPRAEFDDSSFDILTENLGWGDRVPRGSMSESVSGTPILEHYPDIGDIRAAQVGPGESVFYRPGGAGPFDREKIDYGGRKSAAHELQHAIQGREGMTSGASGQNMNYRRNAGEVEARNVEDRIGMSPQERIDAPPWLTEDTPTREQLVPGGRSRRKLAIAEGAAPAAGLGGMLLGEQAQAAAYSENPYAILAPSAQQVINSAQPNVIAEGAVNPRAQQAAMLLRGIETPLDPMLGQGWLTGGISNWLDRAAYGKANWRDRAGAAMDFL